MSKNGAKRPADFDGNRIEWITPHVGVCDVKNPKAIGQSVRCMILLDDSRPGEAVVAPAQATMINSPQAAQKHANEHALAHRLVETLARDVKDLARRVAALEGPRLVR